MMRPTAEDAARWVETCLAEYAKEHGSKDYDTGDVEFSEAGEDYVNTLQEISEGIRSLKPSQ